MGTTIVVDSGCDLERAEALRLGVEIVPISILMGGERLRDGVDIDRATFFKRLAAGEFPKTEAPPKDDYAAVFSRAIGAGNDVVCVTLASVISESHSSASAAAASFGGRVHVVDSRGASGIETLLVRYAVELAASGVPAADIARRIDPATLTNASFFAVPDLNTLQRGGRLPKSVAALGSIMNVSLVLKMNERGAIGPAGQSFSYDKTCEIMVDNAIRTIKHASNVRVCVGHVQDEERAKAMMRMFEAKHGAPVAFSNIFETSLTLAAHLGAGSVGIFAIAP